MADIQKDTPPADAHYYIIKNDDGDWSTKGINTGDRAYFKQEIPAFDKDAPFAFKTYGTREEAVASNDVYPQELLEATFGKLYLWNVKEQRWDRCAEPTIESMGWHAVNFKIYDLRKSRLATE